MVHWLEEPKRHINAGQHGPLYQYWCASVGAAAVTVGFGFRCETSSPWSLYQANQSCGYAMANGFYQKR
jgi:hypothetical protein